MSSFFRGAQRNLGRSSVRSRYSDIERVDTNRYQADWKNFKERDLTNSKTAEEVNKKLETAEKESGFEWKGNDVQEKRGENLPEAIFEFSKMNLHWTIKQNIMLAKYIKPTPIQSHAIPVMLAKRDLMASAETGSGKTAAFLLPILNQILERGPSPKDSEKPLPSSVILAPTRELAQQIFSECETYSLRTPIRPAFLVGGLPMGTQISNLQRGTDIIIATPGRLKDLLRRNYFSLSRVENIVLDEADLMLDMGFEEDVSEIIEGFDLSRERQTVLFSATIPNEIKRLARRYLKDETYIRTNKTTTTDLITQKIEYAPDNAGKIARLTEFLNSLERDKDRALIFVNTKVDVDAVTRRLDAANLSVASIHGDKSQAQRMSALNDFKERRCNILVATNVAARGLNIPQISWVINLDFPPDVESYVHRIGRTGRAGNAGNAMTFFGPEDASKSKELVKILRETNQEVPNWLVRMVDDMSGGRGSRYSDGGYNSRGRPGSRGSSPQRRGRSFGRDFDFDGPSPKGKSRYRSGTWDE